MHTLKERPRTHRCLISLGERQVFPLSNALAEVHIDDVLIGNPRTTGFFLEVVNRSHVDVHGHGLTQALGIWVGPTLAEGCAFADRTRYAVQQKR